MKVKCIKNIDEIGLLYDLTLHKKYKIKNERNDSFYIKNDYGHKIWYDKSWFKIVSEKITDEMIKDVITFYDRNPCFEEIRLSLKYKGYEVEEPK
jgi:hypothetical protein